MKQFELWLEFEQGDTTEWDRTNEFANIQVSLPDGRKYGINVWTYGFFNSELGESKKSDRYLIPPDLFVAEMTRKCIELAIDDLLEEGDLEMVLNPSIIISDD
ncbi:MAG: hypothetical protein AAFX87_18520 [Bacteroidota bacterium]